MPEVAGTQSQPFKRKTQMAIHKTITDKTGYDLDYIRIGQININPILNTYRVEIWGYKDQAAFDDGSEPIMKRVFGLNSTNISEFDLGIDACSSSIVEKLEEATRLIFDDLSDAELI